MDNEEPLWPELARFIKAAKHSLPEPPAEARERVLERVQHSVSGGSPNGGGATALAKGGAALLLVICVSYLALSQRGAVSSPEVTQVVADATMPEQAVLKNNTAVEPESLHPTLAPPREPTPIVQDGTQAASEPEKRRRSPKRPFDGLAAEEALLERARALLLTKPRAALRTINKHANKFPSGQLAEERELLRVRAHHALGGIAAAHEAAAKFLEQYPNSVNRMEMERACKQ